MRRERFGLVLLASEKDALRRLAESEGLTKAATLRGLLRREAKEHGFWPMPAGAADGQPRPGEAEHAR